MLPERVLGCLWYVRTQNTWRGTNSDIISVIVLWEIKTIREELSTVAQFTRVILGATDVSLRSSAMTQTNSTVTCFQSSATQGPTHSSVAQPRQGAPLLCNYHSTWTLTCKADTVTTLFINFLLLPCNYMYFEFRCTLCTTITSILFYFTITDF